MSSRRETLPPKSPTRSGPLPGSRKVYVSGRGGMRVPFREIALTPTRGLRGETELHAPFRVYDTSGPYTDPSAEIDLYARPAGATPPVDRWPAANTTGPRRSARTRRAWR